MESSHRLAARSRVHAFCGIGEVWQGGLLSTSSIERHFDPVEFLDTSVRPGCLGGRGRIKNFREYTRHKAITYDNSAHPGREGRVTRRERNSGDHNRANTCALGKRHGKRVHNINIFKATYAHHRDRRYPWRFRKSLVGRASGWNPFFPLRTGACYNALILRGHEFALSICGGLELLSHSFCFESRQHIPQRLLLTLSLALLHGGLVRY